MKLCKFAFLKVNQLNDRVINSYPNKEVIRTSIENRSTTDFDEISFSMEVRTTSLRLICLVNKHSWW